MSIKSLLGMLDANIQDYEIIEKIRKAQKENKDHVEFVLDGSVVRISLPSVSFDPNADQDSW